MATADTIAIKCPGCQAGFDVPTSLAGKTIRCTSCKTQLPVPTATNGRPRSAGGALPTAKTAPARGSNGPPAKSAADLLPKGKPVSRRRDDDDEDDDDYDDRPRKKKKASGGGSAMPLILAVVGVIVLAGGGVGAYFVFKKDEPVASSGSSGSSNTPAPNGGSRGGPPAGMTPPAPQGGGSGDAPAGWKTHKGNGFSVSMPDWKVQRQTIPGLVPGKGTTNVTLIVAEPAKDDAGLMAVSRQLFDDERKVDGRQFLTAQVTQNAFAGFPGAVRITNHREATVDGHPAEEIDGTINGVAGGDKPIRGKLVIANGLFIAVLGGQDRGANHDQEITQFLGSLKIEAPASSGETVASNTPAGPEAGPPGRPGRRGDDGVQVGPGSGPPPGMTFPTPPSPAPAPGSGPPPGMTFPTPSGPPPGMTFPMPGPNGPPPGMTFPTPSGPPPGMTFPMPGPGGPPPGMTFPMPGPGGPPPGMNIPMPAGPPGGMTFPMPGPGPGTLTPGGGTPGFGGGGSNFIVPPLATQIEPFFAIAFDVEKAEAFTVSMQVLAGRPTYKLNRYSYPGFAIKGDWKIPHLGVRAALDTTNGKLYLATAPMTPATLAQKGDRITGAGDVEVFDLADIRTEKVKARGDLKPASTIATGAPVRGLDVSADGKVLTVLTSRAPAGAKGGKASLRQYDTADRKVIKDKELPNPAWDMTRSADGKSLLVTEHPLGATQALLVCDPTTLEPRPMNLPRGTTDVAPGPDGKMVAASGASGGQAGKLTVFDSAAAPKDVLAAAARKNQNGYARFTPDGKKLLVASHGLEQQNFGPGLDVYDVTDPADPATYKKAGTIRSAGGQYVGGYFHVSPDGERVVVQMTGVVLETAKLTEHTGNAEPPGLEGAGGGPPGAVGPGVLGPGQPGPGQPGPGRPGPGQPGPNQPNPAPGQLGPGQPGPGRPAPGQLGPGQPGPGNPNPAPGELGPGQPGPGRPAPGQLGPGQPGPGNPNPAPGQLGPGQPGPGNPNPAPGQLGPGQPGPGNPNPAAPAAPGTPGVDAPGRPGVPGRGAPGR